MHTERSTPDMEVVNLQARKLTSRQIIVLDQVGIGQHELLKRISKNKNESLLLKFKPSGGPIHWAIPTMIGFGCCLLDSGFSGPILPISS